MMAQPAQCNESCERYRHQHQHPEHNRQEKQKVTVSFLTILAPRLPDCRPVPDDAMRKNKIAARLQPHEHDYQSENKQRKESDCYLQPWPPMVKMRRKHVVGLARSKIDADASNMRSEEHTSELQSHHDLVCR